MEAYEKNTFYHYGHAKVPFPRAVILFSTIVISISLQWAAYLEKCIMKYGGVEEGQKVMEYGDRGRGSSAKCDNKLLSFTNSP